MIFFIELEKNDLEIHMEAQKTLNSQIIPEPKEEVSHT
jgi:hypothetical protein